MSVRVVISARRDEAKALSQGYILTITPNCRSPWEKA
jgi:hypothetical protein